MFGYRVTVLRPDDRVVTTDQLTVWGGLMQTNSKCLRAAAQLLAAIGQCDFDSLPEAVQREALNVAAIAQEHCE